MVDPGCGGSSSAAQVNASTREQEMCERPRKIGVAFRYREMKMHKAELERMKSWRRERCAPGIGVEKRPFVPCLKCELREREGAHRRALRGIESLRASVAPHALVSVGPKYKRGEKICDLSDAQCSKTCATSDGDPGMIRVGRNLAKVTNSDTRVGYRGVGMYELRALTQRGATEAQRVGHLHVTIASCSW